MKRLLDVLFSRWVMFVLLVFSLAEIVWIGSPLLWFGGKHPFQDPSLRWAVITVLIVFAAVAMAWVRWHAVRGNASIVNALLASSFETHSPVESADMRSVRERFDEALLKLRHVRFGHVGAWSWRAASFSGRYLYELPWYLMIGAPGSGKTTALENCGLGFPLAAQGGRPSLRGVGGTRNCDWWFTDQAVLIDTAGRFTTQDSDRAADSATWAGFLGMLKRARPRQPLNGVMVTLSVPDLIARSAADRRAYVAAVRARLQELHRDLGIRFPIYVLVTKSDLLAGFMDYFELLSKEQRATPWGVTFPLEANTAQNVERFGPEFDALLQRIDDGLIERLQAERDLARRARIYGFANQFAGLRSLLIDVLEAVFAPSEDEAEPLLRGVYFVSGTQEGTPIDRVLGAIARTYQLEHAVIPPQHASGKSYFLSRLLGEVVFAESGLAGSNLQWERRRNALLMGGYTAIALLTGSALATWATLYFDSKHNIERVAAEVSTVHKLTQGIADRHTAEILPLLPTMSATAALAPSGAPAASRFSFGLDQRAKLAGALRNVYERMLLDALLPRIEARAAAELRNARAANEGRYDALQTYLMLHEPARRDVATLTRAIEADRGEPPGRAPNAEQRAQLRTHLGALFELAPLATATPEDAALVAFHRTKLLALDVPQRLYGRLRERGLDVEQPAFNLNLAVGAKAAPLFARVSGQPALRQVPGFFSVIAYRGGFQAAAERVVGQAREDEAWVLGAPSTQTAAAAPAAPLVEAMRRLYLAEYAQVWEGYVADLTLAPLSSAAQKREVARTLSAADGPLASLVKAMTEQTTLAPPQTVSNTKPSPAPLAEARDGATADAVNVVDAHFAELHHQLLAPGPGRAPPLLETLQLIDEFSLSAGDAQPPRPPRAAKPPASAAVRLNDAANRAPAPLRAILEKLVTEPSR